MSYENYVLEALERVLALEISEVELGRTVSDQALAMAHANFDQCPWEEEA